MTPQVPRTTQLRGPEQGVSVLELLIAMVLGLGVFGMAAAVTTTTGDATDLTVVRTRLTLETNRLVERIAKELYESGISTMSPASSPLGTSDLTFRQATAYAGAIQWSPDRRYQLRSPANEPDNGVDDDGDGFVDEYEVVYHVTQPSGVVDSLIVVEEVSKLLNGESANGADDNNNNLVDEAGLSFVLDGSSIVIRLTRTARLANGRVLTTTAQTSVTPRNP